MLEVTANILQTLILEILTRQKSPVSMMQNKLEVLLYVISVWTCALCYCVSNEKPALLFEEPTLESDPILKLMSMMNIALIKRLITVMT